jgi:hypothetical protein
MEKERSMRMPKWGRNRNLGITLLAIWLIANGALSLVGSPFPQVALIMAALSIAAGVLLIMGR